MKHLFELIDSSGDGFFAVCAVVLVVVIVIDRLVVQPRLS